jgi:DNA-directed RNA polymerase beta' subunit
MCVQQGGREGLVDTAVKTAQTGYMVRFLLNDAYELSCYTRVGD